jgi:methionine-rich copper-binding protein CopC
VTRSLSRLVALAAALLLLAVLAVPALAHADLVASDPEAGAALETPPGSVRLTFSEGLDAGKSSFRLIGPDGEVGTAKPARDGAKVMRLDDLGLAPGGYTVRWTAAADDGHVERGTFMFTVLEPTPAPATASPAPVATPAATGTPAATSSATAPSPEATATVPAPDATTPAPSATPVAGGGGSPAAGSSADVVIPIVAALALVGGIGLLVLRRSRRA